MDYVLLKRQFHMSGLLKVYGILQYTCHQHHHHHYLLFTLFRYMHKEKMKYSYTRTYRQQNSRDYNNGNVQFLNQCATAEVARTFFNLGSFSSMYNQRDNVLFCLGGGGGIQVFLETRPIPGPPCSPAPFFLYPLPGSEVLKKVTEDIDVLSPGKGILHPLCLSRWDFLTTLHWNSCRLIR